MIINSVEIFKLGFLKHIKMEFSSDDVNIIVGENGSGKSTILAILYSMFQDEEKIKYVSEGETAYINLSIKEGYECFEVTKYFKNGISELGFSSLRDVKRMSSLKQKSIYIFNGEYLNYDYQFTNIMVENALVLLKRCGLLDSFIRKGDINLKGEYSYISEGMQAFIRLLNMLSYISKDSILLLDAPFAMLDMNAIDLLLRVIHSLQIQTIVTSGIHGVEKIKGNKIYLERNWNDGCYDYPSFNHKEIFYCDMKTLIYNQKSKDEQYFEKKIVKYTLGMEVEEPESRNVEYKEIKGNNPCNSIVDTAEIYINAFLNSRVTDIGIIKWGISDTGIVKGVKLSKKDKDTIDRKISERIGQMKPYVSADIVNIFYENILNGNEIAEGLFVVEIVVKRWTSDILFSTSKGNVYIKTEGGRKKLDVYDVQNELKERLKNPRFL